MKKITLFRQGIVMLSMLLLAASLTFTGCGGSSDSYDEPSAAQTAPIAGQTQSVLIDAATLKGWVDSGLVNNDDDWEKVVILDVTSATTYAAGHIPGAQLWAGNSGIDRFDGPVLSGNMVLDGAAMDAALQSYGIDERTTVVFAGSGNPGRIYFMFRYWGFPKDRLKVLNGGKGAWTAAGYALTPIAPDVEPSTYSVRDLSFNPNVRAALNEFIIGVENDTVAPVNTLVNNTDKAGGTTGIFDPSGDYVIFQGLIEGGVNVGYANFYEGGSTTAPLKSVDELKTLLETNGVDGSKPIITYCRAGNAASYGFLPIDAALGWDVMVYDGSWSQWGSLTNETEAAFVPDASYALPALLSEWSTDVLVDQHKLENDGAFFPGPYYNINLGLTIEKPTFRIVEGALSPYDAGANSIEIEDREYFETLPEGGAPTSGSGGSGGGC
ncbi:MAG: hypothetical protein IH613_02390 [Desulfuromonadales bacterium]|nr:hypothetical protein [Desulfuromonadales bacterium]